MTSKRIIGLVMLVAALMFAAADMWQTANPAYGAQDITIGHLWMLISARSMGFVTQHLWSPIWNIGISPILLAPAWTFFGVIGFLFFVFGRPEVSER